MKTMRSATIDNIHGETYTLTVRKHNDKDFDKFGFPYSIRIENTDPTAFDLNARTLLYDDWQTAYKRLRELSEEYKTLKLCVHRDWN